MKRRHPSLHDVRVASGRDAGEERSTEEGVGSLSRDEWLEVDELPSSRADISIIMNNCPFLRLSVKIE